MSQFESLTEVNAGMPLLVGGDRVVRVPEAVATQFRAGDALFVDPSSGQVLLVPAAEKRIAREAVDRALAAFEQMAAVTPQQITAFYESFAQKLEDAAIWESISEVNRQDVTRAAGRGRSITRLVADDKLRRGMIDGLRTWAQATAKRGAVLETVEHEGWVAELVGAELGVVGFVFEGRPNVLADATGVLRSGNTVVFRIGRDALATARAMMTLALEPALAEAGLPAGSAVLVDSAEHAVGWALFSDSRLALAVARGSGPAVDTLGALARQAGVPVSLHGTGGGWLIATPDATAEELGDAVWMSLDRKVCNTLNVCCIPESSAARLVPVLLAAVDKAAQRRGHGSKLHVLRASRAHVPAELFTTTVKVRRAAGDFEEPRAELLEEAELGREWEWEETPELTLVVVRDVDHAIELFNRYSPRLVACQVGGTAQDFERFYAKVSAPFVGDGFTRWVDGQYALRRPELGLSNWQNGRLLGRGAVLSGDSVFTVRTRVRTLPGHPKSRLR